MKTKLYFVPKKQTPLAFSINIFNAYVLPHFLYFAPIANIKEKLMEKLHLLFQKSLKKFLMLKKNHHYENINKISNVPPIKYWADYLGFNTIRKIYTKTDQDN